LLRAIERQLHLGHHSACEGDSEQGVVYVQYIKLGPASSTFRGGRGSAHSIMALHAQHSAVRSWIQSGRDAAKQALNSPTRIDCLRLSLLL